MSCYCQNILVYLLFISFDVVVCFLDTSTIIIRKAVHLVVALILLAAVQAADCPEECVCMWKNGKETTECINRDKDSIPKGIEPSTQVSQLSFSMYLTCFQKYSLISLTNLVNIKRSIKIYIIVFRCWI